MCSRRDTITFNAYNYVIATLFVLICYSASLSEGNLQQYHPMRHYPLQRVHNNPYTKNSGYYSFRQSEPQTQPQTQVLSPSDVEKYNEYQRQIQQWQIAVVVPPGGSTSAGYPPSGTGVPAQGGQSPPPAPPGQVWIQVPAGGTYYPSAPSGPSAPPSSSGGYPGSQPEPAYPNPPPDVSYPTNPVIPPPDNSYPPPDNSYPPPDNNLPQTSPPVSGPISVQPYPEPPSSGLPPSPPNELPASGSSTSDSALKKYCKAPRGQFPGTACSKFVNCWDDVVVEQECPASLYFNPGGFCDYPYNVECKDGDSPKEPSPGVPSGGIDAPQGPGSPPSGLPPPIESYPPPGSYPPPPPPGSYPPSPPPGSYPPSPPQGSVPPSPPQGIPPPSQPSPPSTSPEVDVGASGTCPSSYGTYRSKTNCGQFYVCVGGKPYEFICPAGLNFHEDLKVCDYPYRVECNGVPTNPIPPETEGEEGSEGGASPAQPVESTPPPAVAGPPPSPVSENPSYYGLRNFYNYNTGLNSLNMGRYHCMGRNNFVYRLSPTCSSVAVCQNGYPQVINCGQGQGYDTYSRRCLSVYQARC